MSEFEVLSRVIEISHLEEHVESKLIKIISYLKDELEFNDIHFLILKKENNMLQLNYSTNQKMPVRHRMIRTDDDALFGVFESRKNIFINNFTITPEFNSDISPEWKGSLFVLPILNFSDFFGVVLGEKKTEFTSLDEKLLSLISIEISGMISNANSFVELNKRIYELSTFYTISKLFNRNERLDDLCGRIVEHISTLLYANTVFLELFNPGFDDITHKMYIHDKEKSYPMDGFLIKNIIKEVKTTGKPAYIKDSSADERCMNCEKVFLTAIFVPIRYNSSVMGVIGLIDKETNFFITEKYFSDDDLNILETLSSQFANFIENMIITKEKEKILKDNENKAWELSILYDVSKAMLNTVKLDSLLYNILTAVTISGGLGFNRAGLFLVNHRMKILQGMLGIGPDSGEDADRIWKELEKEQKTLLQWMKHGTESPGVKESKFDEKIKSIRIPLEKHDEALIEAIDQRKALMVASAGQNGGSEFISKLNSESYAAVPLMAKDKVLGAIFVDNNITRRPISGDDLNFLTLFANQAGLAIENATLYSNLKKANNDLRDTHDKLLHNEKLAALGEMAADVAHEIKNPLTSIGGFARRLDRRFLGETDEKKYVGIIIKEVSRLEKILNEILSFSKEEKINNFQLNDINCIINETLIMFDNEFLENNINVATNMQNDLPLIECDYQQLKQAIINIVNNSCQAMKNSGTLTINTRKSLLRNKDSVVVEVSDTGGGVNNDVIHNIFNPFFTTKDGGTGLGLAITHRLIANHSGSVDVDNKPGAGVTFIINIPVEKPFEKENSNANNNNGGEK